MLVDDAGPDVGHLGPLGELVDDEGVELPGHRVYDDYLRELAKTHQDNFAVLAVSLIGSRNQVAKLVRHLKLLP